MPKRSEGLEQLLVEELQDLFDAEKQLVKALPRMAKSATDGELENALRQHLEVTKGQVQRLEQVFEAMDMRARSRPCKGMKGIVEEGQEMLQEDHEEGILDSAITGAARKVEHYEMAGYQSVRSLAVQIGRRDVAQLLDETLREEMETDRQLAQISKRLLKEATLRPQMEMEQKQSGRSRSRGTSSRSNSRSAGSSGKSSRSEGRQSQSSRGRSSSSGGGQRGGSAHPLTEHEEIRQWAEERGAHPACVRRTGGKGDVGMIRLDFPGYSGAQSLQPISWDEWFERFDERGLALMVQDKTARGQQSNFNKLVSRESAEQKSRPKTRAAH